MYETSYDYLIYIGLAGVFFGIIYLIYFFVTRFFWFLGLLVQRTVTTPKYGRAFRNVSLGIIWTVFFSVLVFMGFTSKFYKGYVPEERIGQITVNTVSDKRKAEVTLEQFSGTDVEMSKKVEIKGRSWSLYGEILVWDDWLSFLKLDQRYRFQAFTPQTAGYSKTAKTNYDDNVAEVNNMDYISEQLFVLMQYQPFMHTIKARADFQLSGFKNVYYLYAFQDGFKIQEK